MVFASALSTRAILGVTRGQKLWSQEQQDELLGAVRADRFAEQSIQEAL